MKIIELIWPSLEGEPSVYNDFLENENNISDENLDQSVEFAKFMYEKQKERVSTIESKSSIYLGFFGTVVAILAFALKDILFLTDKTHVHDLALFVGGVLVLYIVQVMRYSIKALERKEYHSFDEGDFLHGNKKKIVYGLINKVKKNYDVINSKVEFMTMAHEFAKRIIWIIFFAAIMLIISSLYKYISLIPQNNFNISSINISLRWSDYVLSIVIFVLVVNHIRIRSIEKKIKK